MDALSPGALRAWARRVAWACLFGAACLAPVQGQQVSFRKYSQADGLINLATRHLVRAPNGDMWVGTEAGLFRFDGTAFVAVDASRGLPMDSVRGLVVDASGRLWVWFERGDLYVGGAAGFTPVKTADRDMRPDADRSLAVLSDDRLIAVVNRKAVQFLRAGPKAPWTAQALFSVAQRSATPGLDDVRAPTIDRRGTLWLGCGKGVCSMDGGSVRFWGAADGVAEDDWSAFLEDREGRLWARGPAHLAVLEAGGPRFQAREPPEGARSILLFALAMDEKGRVLTSTRSGIARWTGSEWRSYTPAHGLPRSLLNAVTPDAQGNLWLSVLGQGIWRWIGYEHFESWTATDGLAHDSVYHLIRDAQGLLLLGTAGGCQWLDEAQRRVVPCPFGTPDGVPIISFAQGAKGELWLGGGNARLLRLDADEAQARVVATLGTIGSISQVSLDADQVGWVAGTLNGLHRLDPVMGTTERVPGTAGRVWETVATGPNERCAATAQGLARITGVQAQMVAVTRNGRDEGFSAISVDAAGIVWAASDSRGILRAPGCRAEGAVWVDDPLITRAHAYFVRIDRRGWLWAGTDQGLGVFDGKRWRRVDTNDGLVWNDVNQNGFFADTDGSIWIGTAAGVTHLTDPEGWLRSQDRPLDLAIASSRLGDRTIETQGGTTRIPWKRDAEFRVHLTSQSHDRSPRTEYHYRLIGLSDQWSSTRVPEITVPGLEPGSYRLEARAVDTEHARIAPTIEMAFVVVPPWWRTPELRVGLALFVAGALGWAWRRQVMRLHARRQAMESEYRERQALLERATRDGLTGLWNRSAIMEILGREIAHSRRSNSPMGIAMLDVDHFKRINDTYGHLGGDDVLKELSARITEALRRTDWVGRFGGEELLVVLTGLELGDRPLPVDKLRECVADRPFTARELSIPVTLSIGFAWLEPGVDDPQALIARADAALYEAKRSGRNRVVFAQRSSAVPDAEALEVDHL